VSVVAEKMAQQQVAIFLETFHVLEKTVKAFLDGGQLSSASEELQKLSKLVSEYGLSLPSYELRKAQASITKLQSAVVALEETANPKRKFKFSRKTPTNGQQQKPQPKTIDQIDSCIKASLEPTISGLLDAAIVLEAEQTNKKDLWLDNLENCSVIIKGVPSTVHLTKMRGCTVVGGPVMTSVFLEECHNSKVVIGCQQLRTHKSHHCDFYLHVRSRAIIEDCSDCRFAPYNRKYTGATEEFAAAQLDAGVNHWDQVDDFNWLSSEKASPNWSFIPENERVPSWL